MIRHAHFGLNRKYPMKILLSSSLIHLFSSMSYQGLRVFSNYPLS